MAVLLLTENDVRQLLTMDMALEAVEQALRKLALDEAQNVPRSRVQTDHAMLHVLSAAAKTLGVMGYKAYATRGKKAEQFHVALYDGKSGSLLALIQADYLGQIRTGAASGVATEYMARPDASEVGLFGSGKQARTQLLAVCKVRKVTRVQVYSPNDERRRRFAHEMSELCQTEVEPVPRPEMAAEDKDIVITATTSREPVLNGHWIAEGTHLNVIGSNFLGKAEIDAVGVRRCNSIVVDSKDQARLEAGDFVQALEEGSIHWADIHELGQVIVGRYTGRAHPQDVTLFKSLGIAVEDIAVAARVYQKAKEANVGQAVDW
ncbi:MAG TPA: ornithine cyclodeaminase family protein [Gemmataceae bacterium]|jgi:ornithine cyclodeaminase/alanine dehydrogenase-like protein (mu-crystallin family)|nr:ornithine cyclodeaminase family protein [Gemmataceae bacterium]